MKIRCGMMLSQYKLESFSVSRKKKFIQFIPKGYVFSLKLTSFNFSDFHKNIRCLAYTTWLHICENNYRLDHTKTLFLRWTLIWYYGKTYSALKNNFGSFQKKFTHLCLWSILLVIILGFFWSRITPYDSLTFVLPPFRSTKRFSAEIMYSKFSVCHHVQLTIILIWQPKTYTSHFITTKLN